MKALAIAATLLGLSAASLPAHAFQAQLPGAVAAPSAGATTVGYYDRDGYYRRHHGYYDRDYRRGYDRRDYGRRDYGRGDYGRGGGYRGGPGRPPNAVIVTPNRPGVYYQGGIRVEQH